MNAGGITLTPAQTRGALVAAALGGGYSLLSLRLVPVPIMRAWLVLTVLGTVFTGSAACYVIDALRYVGVPRRITQLLCTVTMSVAFKLAARLNPQVKRRVHFDGVNDEGQPLGWRDVPERSALVLNHTSFWDIFEFILHAPLAKLAFTRTLLKASLTKIPVFGGMLTGKVGHFPVYFKSDGEGHFEVDKERQAAVQVLVDEHINRGGNLAIFPEGAVNKNPKVLQTFRYGTFATIFAHRMPVFYMVMAGNEKTWPREAPYGGAPADIVVRIGRYPIDFDKTDSKQVAAEMRDFMQKVYDEADAETEQMSLARRRRAKEGKGKTQDEAGAAANAEQPALAPAQ